MHAPVPPKKQPKFRSTSLPRNEKVHPEEKSQHILNASSTLLGFCFIVVTTIKVTDVDYKTIMDEIGTVATMLFMCSCLLSFLSIRGTLRRARRLEDAADVVFLAGLLLLFITTVLYSLNLIR